MNPEFLKHGIEIPDDATGQINTTCSKCSLTRKKSNVKCLSVNIAIGAWQCHHCGDKGRLNSATVPNDRPIKYVKPDYQENLEFRKEQYQWLINRGISDEVIRKNRVSSQIIYMPQIEDFAQTIAFPYLRNKEVVNVKYRDKDKNFRLVKDAEKIFYGIDDLDVFGAVVVEGEIDKLSFDTVGIPAISVPNGAPAPGTKMETVKFDYLENCKEKLDTVRRFIVCTDNDIAGRALGEELARRFGFERCWAVKWPEGCKDANEVLLKHGQQALKDMVLSATAWPIEGIFQNSDLSLAVDDLYHKGTQRGLSTGWHNLDQLYSIRPGEWTVVTGIPSHGKSEFMDALIVNLAIKHDWKIAICSPENQPLERHIAKLAEKITGKPFCEGITPRMSFDLLQDTKQFMGDHFYFILTQNASLDNILSKVKACIARYGVNGFVLDPWTELEHARPREMTETEYISQSLSKIRNFARQYKLHIWVIAHPAKMFKENGVYPVPTPYDISGSAHWRNKSDCALTVWRDAQNQDADIANMVEIHVQKIRFKDVGMQGIAKLKYDLITGRFAEVPHETDMDKNAGTMARHPGYKN